MALPPLSYNFRSLMRRRGSTLLTVFGIAATVAVCCGILALQQGFQTLFVESGQNDVVVMMRPGANSEGESAFPKDRADVMVKSTPEIAIGSQGPLASREMFLASRLRKTDGGETNVPLRGVEPAAFEIHGERFRILEGRKFERGTDELIVSQPISQRIRDCKVGDVLQLNTTSFRVVGIFECEGAYNSEIWGDTDRLMEALERPVLQRILAQLTPDSDVAALAKRLKSHKEVPAKVMSEREYFSAQTQALSVSLWALGILLLLFMGTAAAFTGINTMLAMVSSRTHEIGVLLSLGFRPLPIFFTFLVESLILGIFGGLIGCLLVLPLNGLKTGTTNFQTFTEVAFAFRITPTVMTTGIVISLVIGLIAGSWPAFRAANMRPTEALRRV